MSTTIRPARPGEAPLVLAFVRELAAFEKLSYAVGATEEALDEALFGPAASVFCDIAESAGEPAGCALWFLKFSSFRGCNGLYLEDLFVRPAHRGCGIGRALLRHLAKRCIAESWSRLEWTVSDWNEDAIGFYRAQGASVLSSWRLCRGENAALRRLAEGDTESGLR